MFARFPVFDLCDMITQMTFNLNQKPCIEILCVQRFQIFLLDVSNFLWPLPNHDTLTHVIKASTYQVHVKSIFVFSYISFLRIFLVFDLWLPYVFTYTKPLNMLHPHTKYEEHPSFLS